MTLGARLPRVDAEAKTTGEATYSADRHAEAALVGKVVFTNQPHARLKKLDITKALNAPGVVAIVTADDVPVNEYGLTMFDQPVFIAQNAGSETGPLVPANVSRWEADHLCLVIAETEDAAIAAAELIETEWEQLRIVCDVDAALADGAILVHPEHNPTCNNPGQNAYHHYVIRKGNTVSAMANAQVVVEAEYEVGYQEHAYLETEAALAYFDEQRRITVETGGQWVHEDQEQVAHALNLPPDQVRIIYNTVGGAFGGKEDMSLQIVLALAIQKLAALGIDRPVRSEWSREESIIGHHKRHRAQIKTKWGATAAGKIVAVEAECYLDAGAYNYTSNKVLGNLHLTVAGPYEIDNANIDSWAVYTNTVPGGAFRGFGAPQGCFVAESQMNKLASACGIDPLEIRRLNILDDDSVGITGTKLPAGVSMAQVLDTCVTTAAWATPKGPPKPMAPFASLPASDRTVKRGRGLACAYKNIGFSFGFPERSEAKIVLHGDSDKPSSAELFLAGAEVGQGAHTAFLQIAAEATGLDIEQIATKFSDTATSDDSGSASASRLTFMSGNAIIGAAEKAVEAWQAGARPATGSFRYVPPATEPLDPQGSPTVPNFAYGYVAETVDLSVDVATGHIVVHDVVCAVDVGRAVNPQLIEGQVEGAIVQAHGYALSEKLLVSEGRILNPRFSGYLIPGIGDIPTQVRTAIVETSDPVGPYGIRGMAEMPLIPYAPAVAAALFDATGVWFDKLPLTPETVLTGLHGY